MRQPSRFELPDLFAALPPMTRVEREADAIDWLTTLAAEPLST